MNASSAIEPRSDSELLAAFADRGDEDAFRALVERHLGLVFSVALRRTGRHALAEEIAQSVFTALARRAARLDAGVTLAGWLHRATVLESADFLRRERAHDRKMKAYAEQVKLGPSRNDAAQIAAPVIDEAIAALPARDRELVLLRFFQGHSFREIGGRLGKSEDAAQKQCERALSKLARVLARAGVTLPAQALAGTLSQGLVSSAPPGLGAAVAAGALSNASALGVKALVFQALDVMATTKSRIAVTVAVMAALPLAWQWQEIRRLRRDLAELRQSAAGNSSTESSRPAGVPAFDPNRKLPANRSVSPAPAGGTAPTSIATLWEQALLEPDPVRRMQRISELLATLTADSAPAVADVFLRLKQGGSNQETEYGLFLRSWGRIDGATAVEFALSHGRKGLASSDVGAALAGWASMAPEAARSWAEGQPEGESKETALFGLLDGWSLLDFDAAAAYAASRPRSPARNEFRELLLERALAAGGVPEAQRWFSSIPDDEHNQLYKQRALDEVIHAMLYRDPSAAAQWVQQIGDGHWLEGSAVTEVAAKLSESAPLEALQWLNSLTSVKTDQRDAGLQATMKQWAKADSNAAGTCLQQHATDPGYDSLAGTYALAIASTDIKSAVAWAQSVHDDAARSRSVTTVVSGAQSAFGETAADQLRAAGLSDAEIASTQSHPDRASAGLAADQLSLEKSLYEASLNPAIRRKDIMIEELKKRLLRQSRDLPSAPLAVSSGLDAAEDNLATAPGGGSSTTQALDPQVGGITGEGSGSDPTARSPAPRVNFGWWQRFAAAHDPKSISADCRSCHQQ